MKVINYFFFFYNCLIILFLIIGINIFKQKKIIKGAITAMAEQTTEDTISEHQYTELSNVHLIPSTSSENVPLNTTKSRGFNIPQVNKVHIIFRILNKELIKDYKFKIKKKNKTFT